MPYYIEKNNPDCKSGWATTGADGTVHGCHKTKASAIDQAIAISLSTHEPFKGERAAVDSLKPGDYVSWNPLDPEILAEIVMVEGELAVVQLYDFEDGVFEPSDKMMIINILKLEVVPRPELVVEPEMPDVPDAPTTMPADTAMRDAGDWSMLTERQQTQAQDTAELATEFGMFNQGSGADGAHYFEQNPFAAEGVKCGNCIFFNAERSQCQVVEGAINSEAVCKLWVIPESDLVNTPDNLNSMNEPRNKWTNAAERIIARLNGEVRNVASTEVRTNHTDFEIRASGDGMTFTGYAAVFNSDSQPLPFTERIAPGAFKRSLQSRNEVKLLWNHDSGEPLASVRGGTLKLVEDAKGLRVEAQLANTTRGRDVAELIRSKTIDSMSFGFSVIKDSWSNDGGLRTLDAVRLFEVSIVSSPAYESTAGTIAVRSATGIDADTLANALMRLESGEELDPTQAILITDVVAKLTKTEEVQEVEGDILALKKKKLDLLLKEI